MLQQIAPHLAMTSIHKNGTWAAQKIIECSITPAERDLIITHLRPFIPPLMCDNLGNYVCAGTLKFGEPWSTVIWDAMVDRLWDVAQSRFGARCMRTCLESLYASLYQKVSVFRNKERGMLTWAVETGRCWDYTQLDTAGDEPEWSVVIDLAGGWFGLAGTTGFIGAEICAAYCASMSA
jgi:hypothetical protein